MSERETIAEIAEREAREAEAEQTGDDATAEGDDGPSLPEPATTNTATTDAPPIDYERAQKQIEAESKRHAKRVAEIMGDAFADVHDCPLCQIPGFVFPFQPGTPMDEDRRLAVEAYFGATAQPLNLDENKERCPTCDGWGKLRTPSRNPVHQEVVCDACGALGWVQKSARVQPVAQPGSLLSAVPNGGGGAEDVTMPDLWGRPFGHPHYGMHPAAIGAGA